ncbi:DUF4035 domain-containing protein [Burkholderia vietnamiensis]|uniref:phage tail assembly protein T n=1 Tax=Burkholderia vietnamiensis TaxID=60552 RepID=UPI0009C0D3C6|nr:DUF4035 domain-containing protein [Burkholderia vietnamiensis]
MSSAEFGYWKAFYSLEPFGDRIDDIRMGTVASVVANVNRKADTPPFKPKDFIPWAHEPETKESAPSAEAVAVSVFGINLVELKASGKKHVVIRNPKSAGTN